MAATSKDAADEKYLIVVKILTAPHTAALTLWKAHTDAGAGIFLAQQRKIKSQPRIETVETGPNGLADRQRHARRSPVVNFRKYRLVRVFTFPQRVGCRVSKSNNLRTRVRQ